MGVLVLFGLLAGCGGSESVEPGGSPARLEFSPGMVATAYTGNIVPAGPVRVLDAEGRPVKGAQVQFFIDGGGELAWPVAYTDRDGNAWGGGWRLGSSPGAQLLTAQSRDITVTVSVNAIAPPSPQFEIALYYVRDFGLYEADKMGFARAAVRWQEIVLGDLPDTPMPSALPGGCPGVPLELRGATIDDLQILIVAEKMDAASATTTICARRSGEGLPSVVTIRIDPDKARAFGMYGTMAHEIGHALGIGTLWGPKVVDYNGELRYGGAFATAAYQLTKGPPASNEHFGVPMESKGGAGIARVHWSEDLLGVELLTALPNTGFEPISAISAGSLRDLGYLVDDARSDDFELQGTAVRDHSPPSVTAGSTRPARVAGIHAAKRAAPPSIAVTRSSVAGSLWLTP